MNNEWKLAEEDERLFGYRCVKNKVSKELALIGKYGEIWKYDNNTCKAIIVSASTANKFLKPEEKYKIGDEALVKFPLSELKVWVERLKIFKKAPQMLKWANK